MKVKEQEEVNDRWKEVPESELKGLEAKLCQQKIRSSRTISPMSWLLWN